jgi:protein-S-isoprenylcysteine O-methyltransferase Ste14
MVFAVIACIALHFQILQEERFLTKTYGMAYRDYCARTGRYFTWRAAGSI